MKLQTKDIIFILIIVVLVLILAYGAYAGVRVKEEINQLNYQF